jgi:hypothetical protein
MASPRSTADKRRDRSSATSTQNFATSFKANVIVVYPISPSLLFRCIHGRWSFDIRSRRSQAKEMPKPKVALRLPSSPVHLLLAILLDVACVLCILSSFANHTEDSSENLMLLLAFFLSDASALLINTQLLKPGRVRWKAYKQDYIAPAGI